MILYLAFLPKILVKVNTHLQIENYRVIFVTDLILVLFLRILLLFVAYKIVRKLGHLYYFQRLN